MFHVVVGVMAKDRTWGSGGVVGEGEGDTVGTGDAGTVGDGGTTVGDGEAVAVLGGVADGCGATVTGREAGVAVGETIEAETVGVSAVTLGGRGLGLG